MNAGENTDKGPTCIGRGRNIPYQELKDKLKGKKREQDMENWKEGEYRIK
jgi:hypothetical protein